MYGCNRCKPYNHIQWCSTVGYNIECYTVSNGFISNDHVAAVSLGENVSLLVYIKWFDWFDSIHCG